VDLGADGSDCDVFAWLHDCCRLGEDHTPGHGARAADLAEALNGSLFNFERERMELLLTAIRHHADGRVSDDPSNDACCGADSVELVRIGSEPARRFFSERNWPVAERILMGKK
jgi:uncharacterized protein